MTSYVNLVFIFQDNEIFSEFGSYNSTFKGVEKESSEVDTGLSAPKRLAKFGWQTQTFFNKKMGKNGLQSLAHTDLQ